MPALWIGTSGWVYVHPDMPLDLRLTADWTYVRFHAGRHGIGYGDDELRLWANHISAFQRRGADVYAYFNNDLEGHALRDAPRLRDLLAGEQQIQAA